ncbi:TolC family protein [Vibrio sp. 10N.261.55.E12]|uniref:TolC family protein n=2 Tax=unclassified Vibrio TaxID=2614977 RepID=UPI00354B8A11
MFLLLIIGCSNIKSNYFDYEKKTKVENEQGDWLYDIEESNLLTAPYLNELLASVIINNFELNLAILDIKKGELNTKKKDDEQGVQMNINVSSSHSKYLDHGDESSGNYSTSFGLSYDVDFFGKKNIEDKLMSIDQELSFLDFLGLKNDITTLVINEYVSISSNKLKLDVYKRIKDIRIDILKIERERLDSGVSVGSEVLSAQQSLDSAVAIIENIKEEIFNSVNRIEFFSGNTEFIDIIKISEVDVINLPDVTFSDLPKFAGTHHSVLGSMLQIKSSELNFELEEVAWYPQFSISGSIGTQGEKLREIFENPFGSMSSLLIFPVIEWHKRTTNMGLVNADLTTAHLNYENVISSVVDVMNSSLINLYAAQRHYEISQIELSTARLTRYYSLNNYNAGFTSKYADLLTEFDFLNSKLTEIDAQYNLVTAKVELCSALDYRGCL